MAEKDLRNHHPKLMQVHPTKKRQDERFSANRTKVELNSICSGKASFRLHASTQLSMSGFFLLKIAISARTEPGRSMSGRQSRTDTK
jgi:hypothetical protein